MSLAVVMLVGFTMKAMGSAKNDNEQVDIPVNLQKADPVSTETIITPVTSNTYIEDKEEIESINEVKEQMDKERTQMKNMKLLYMELDQIKLQYEKEKTLSEIKKLRKENIDVTGEMGVSDDKTLEVRVLFIGSSDKQKEAIISINGANYTVKEKEKPVANLEILSISNTGIDVQITGKETIIKTIVYRGN